MVRAYNLIEELMVAANEAVGRIAASAKLPAPFRVHAGPDATKLDMLAAGAESLGVRVRAEELSRPRGMQKFLKSVQDRKAAPALNMLLLRTMAQAEYRTENVGHFALASSAYVHFTSPIRRYPDLVAHRALKAHLARTGGRPGPAPVPKMPTLRSTQAQCDHAGSRERASASAERDARALFAAMYMYMRDRIGDRLEGSVSGLSTSGVFVQLDDPFVDGMIRLADLERELGGRFERDPAGVLLRERGGAQRRIALGDRVIVEVVAASLARRQIDPRSQLAARRRPRPRLPSRPRGPRVHTRSRR
jgi:ribonuclease R